MNVRPAAMACLLAPALGAPAAPPAPVAVLATTEQLAAGPFPDDPARGLARERAEGPDADAGRAIRYRIGTAGDVPWSVTSGVGGFGPLRRGTPLYLTFAARAAQTFDESGEALFTAVFERNGPPHNKSLQLEVAVGPGWKRFAAPFRVDADYPAGGAAFVLHLGARRQVVEIADLSLVQLLPDADLAALPASSRSYDGLAADAPWRAAAEARIEAHRKAAFTLDIVDAAGQPVPGAAVKVELQRHAFPFGTCVKSELYADPETSRATPAERARYREILHAHFNAAGPENDLKWNDWSLKQDYRWAEAAVDELRRNGLVVRGHVLVWPGWRNLPSSLKQHRDDPVRLRAEVSNHITTLAARFRDRLRAWDVVNEPKDNHDLLDILGREVMADWFRLAHAADPGARLLLNDYGVLSGGTHLDSMEQTARALLDQGAPIQGLGLQSHFGAVMTPPATVLARLDRLAKLGLAIEITEFDMDTDDAALQAAYLRDFLTAVFSHPAVEAFQMWGFWEGAHWRPAAALWDRDFNIRPHGQAYVDLVDGKWWTRATGESDAAGRFAGRGFLGTYRVTATHAGRTVDGDFELRRDGAPWRLQL